MIYFLKVVASTRIRILVGEFVSRSVDGGLTSAPFAQSAVFITETPDTETGYRQLKRFTDCEDLAGTELQLVAYQPVGVSK